MTTVEIAVAFRDATGQYIRPVAAMLASVLACTARPLRLHVLHDETLTAAHRDGLQAMVRQAGRTIAFHALDPRRCLPGVDETSPIMQPLTYATLYRLFIPTLPAFASCRRLLYMDTDLLADTDLSVLWDMDMEGAALGAVPDPCLCGALLRKGDDPRHVWARKAARYSLQQGIPNSRYFNAGVLLLDLDAIRAEGLFEAATRLVLDIPNLLHPDQDALNKIFFNRSIFIPKKFNYLLHSDAVDDLTEGVWHFSGPRKPWLQDMPKAHRYHYYLSRTPWSAGGPA